MLLFAGAKETKLFNSIQPDCLLWKLQNGIIYSVLSVLLHFLTCAPTISVLEQPFALQIVAIPGECLCQWSSHDLHLHFLLEVPFKFFTVMVFRFNFFQISE
jgi:hypothetical protein